MNYYYKVNSEYPKNVTANVSRIIASANNCPSNVESTGPGGGGNTKGGGLAQYLAQYDEWNEQYKYWRAKAMEFCGETGKKEKGEGGKEKGGDDEECAMMWDKVSYYSALKDNYFNRIITAAMNNNEDNENSYDLMVLRSYGLTHRYLLCKNNHRGRVCG